MDTICALATAPGGALGIIRISGPQTLEILSHVFSKDLTQAQPNTIHYGHIADKPSSISHHPSDIIDEVLVSVFRAPHSYTGEDSAEISCHGSRYILNKVLEILIQHGCRMANPGEYTQRAFLNGKIDLSQAEAVADLIASSNKATHQIAMSQLRGHFSSELSRLREKLLKLTSLLELELDFSDHEDLEFADRSELLSIAKDIAIVGKTNVGKSTLLNHLLHEDRAIVSDIHGTTRDTIEDTIDLNGVTFRFIDTAGIRQTTDTIEQIGIERTYAAIEKARIVIWMIEEQANREEIEELMQLTKGKEAIVVCNKADKINFDTFIPPVVPLLCISAKTGYNIDKLESKLFEAAKIPELTDNDIIVTSARQYDALVHAEDNLSRVLEGLETNLSGDLIAEDLRLVLSDLAEITGDKGIIQSQEVLNNIFQHFCVGK